MRKNLSPSECDIRGAIIAPVLALIAIGAGVETAGGILALTAAVAFFITAYTGYCPVYGLFESSEDALTA